jgi:LuxR family maltose regulon positive regulatory protein
VSRDPGPLAAALQGVGRAGGAHRETERASPFPFDVLEGKIAIPAARPGDVSRTALVNRLRATTEVPVATLTAPAGYGKTTLLGQWAGRDARAFAWLALDSRDNDPVALVRHIAAALDQVGAVDSWVTDALRFPGESIWTAALPRLATAVASRAQPFVLVLDDAHVLRAGDQTEALRALADHMRGGSMVVLAGRRPSALPIAAWRASGTLLELGAGDLALSRREGELLLRGSGIRVSPAEAAVLVAATEGWPAGLRLAAQELEGREQATASVPRATISGADRDIADYLRAETLAHVSTERLAFLRRTSVLERMCGPLCDAVLQRAGSTRELADVERSNLLIVPLDRRREWYRYHRLLRDLLRRELDELEPELVPELHRRAADWYEERGDLESTLPHAHAAGDFERAATIIATIALPAYQHGRIAAVEAWLERFDDASLKRFPAVAVVAAWIHAMRGRSAAAVRLLAMAAAQTLDDPLPDGCTSLRPWAAVVRAGLCRDGVDTMLADARAALAELPESSPWRPAALAIQGAAHLLLADLEHADDVLAAAAEAAEEVDAPSARVGALGERALVASERGDFQAAEAMALEANALVEKDALDGYVASVLTRIAGARALLRHGRWDEAHAELAAARQLTPSLTNALPWLAVQARIELARAHVALRDEDAARRLVVELDDIVANSAPLGVLAARVAALRDEIEAIRETDDVTLSGLTAAELRLLPFLATHLSFREIGERLFVSRNTIKTQAISVYRKLGVSSRTAAIERASELGLVDVANDPSRFIQSG